jgi:PleD family two-component response regulator
LCRFGGEEFLLVLPGTGRESTVERAEQLRHEIAAVPVVVGSERIPITASFGVATFPINGRTGDELISAADKALYAAKAGGRNRVDVAPVMRQAMPGPTPDQVEQHSRPGDWSPTSVAGPRGANALMQADAEQSVTLGVLFIDADHFKDVNDTFGHKTGDDVLHVRPVPGQRTAPR